MKFMDRLWQTLNLLLSLWLVLYAKHFVYLSFSLCKTYNRLALLSSFLLISPFAHLVQSLHFVTKYLALEATFVKKGGHIVWLLFLSFLIYVFFIATTVSPPVSSSHLPSIPLLCLPSEGYGHPSELTNHGISSWGRIKRLPLASRQDRASHHRE